MATGSSQHKLDVDAALAAGLSPDEIITQVRVAAQAHNRAARAAMPDPPKMPKAQWDTRRDWLLDGQPIHGELKEFSWAAEDALRADDQAAYSLQRDLLFKAVRTFIGPRPEPPLFTVAQDVPVVE